MLDVKVRQLGAAVRAAAGRVLGQQAALLGLKHGSDVHHGLHHTLAGRVTPRGHSGTLGFQGGRVDAVGGPGGQHRLTAGASLLARRAKVISRRAGNATDVRALLRGGLHQLECAILAAPEQHHQGATAHAHQGAVVLFTTTMAVMALMALMALVTGTPRVHARAPVA